MEKAVSNATVLIFLSKLNRLDLLWNKYSEVVVPEKVKEEVLAKEDNFVLANLLSHSVIKTAQAKKDLSLGAGETEAILLCCEERISDFLSDDNRARNVARAFKLNAIGTVGILLWNLQHKKISSRECSDLLDELLKKQYFISTELYVSIKKLIESAAPFKVS